jgi:hypothetical protein
VIYALGQVLSFLLFLRHLLCLEFFADLSRSALPALLLAIPPAILYDAIA